MRPSLAGLAGVSVLGAGHSISRGSGQFRKPRAGIAGRTAGFGHNGDESR